MPGLFDLLFYIHLCFNSSVRSVQAVVAVAKELEAESYHDIKRITARKDNVIRLWEYLLELLKARRQRLELNLGLQRVFQEMLYIMDWMDEMKVETLRQHSVFYKYTPLTTNKLCCMFASTSIKNVWLICVV